MNAPVKLDGLEVGYDIPALPGMDEADIQTPCLVLDLDALEAWFARGAVVEPPALGRVKDVGAN